MMKLFYLMGKSASGKDTIYKRLMSDASLGLSPLVPYTTRPIRTGEVEGRDYHFTDEAGMKALEESGRVIERRTYHTIHGDWHYFTVDENIEEGTLLAIGTPESYEKILSYYGKEVCRPVYITLDDGERLSRALARERSQAEPKYKELCRRFLADDEDFKEERLEKLGIAKRFENIDLENCVLEVADYIRHG